jgi:hypothetical protein
MFKKIFVFYLGKKPKHWKCECLTGTAQSGIALPEIASNPFTCSSQQRILHFIIFHIKILLEKDFFSYGKLGRVMKGTAQWLQPC